MNHILVALHHISYSTNHKLAVCGAAAMGRWLLVGALEAETSPIIARLRSPAPAVAAEWEHVAVWGSANGDIHQAVTFVSGELDGVAVSVLTVGVGPANAERYTRHALEAMLPELPSGVISFGTCGSLVNSLQAGDVVTATALFVEGDAEDSDSTKQRLQMAPVGSSLPQVAMATCKVPVFDPERRGTLASLGCEVCEMEANGVLDGAAAVLGTDTAERLFGSVKVVSDQAGATEDDLYGQGIGKAFDRDAFLATARDICTNKLGPVLGDCLRASAASAAAPRL